MADDVDPSKSDLYEDQLPPADALGVDGNEPSDVADDGIAHGVVADVHAPDPGPAPVVVEAPPAASPAE